MSNYIIYVWDMWYLIVYTLEIFGKQIKLSSKMYSLFRYIINQLEQQIIY